jgi:YjjG family noncanonical pyrimidine nucleotidase
MKYDLILFDFDDTLVDFKKSEHKTFELTLNEFKIPHSDIFETLYSGYQKINEHIWAQHALGKVSKEDLKTLRFQLFLNQFELQADAHLMGEFYISQLPHQIYLMNEALELCQHLHLKTQLGIVTNGIGRIQKQRLDNSGLKDFFNFMVVSEVCGHSKPDRRIFDYTFDLAQQLTQKKPQNILMVGDRIDTDILGAHNSGIDSCWFNPDSLHNQSEIKAHFEIKRLSELVKYLH